MKASVIVLVWNGMEHLKACLETVLAQDYPDYEVIVVDNGSSDGSGGFVQREYPQVRLVCNQDNLGFSAGNNAGLQAAAGDALVLLNQDTAVRPHWLAALTQVLQAEPGLGIAGAKALYPDGVTLQHAGGYVDERGEGRHYGYRQQDAEQFDQLRDVDYVTGASLAITRPALEAIGPLDEGFNLAYYEDMDWCCRAREAGFRVVYAPQAVLIHREASAAAPNDYARMVSYQRNRLRFVLKHWTCDRLTGEFAQAERAWLAGLGQGAELLVAATQSAYFHHLAHLDDLLASRRDGRSMQTAQAMARVLLSLRAVVPLGPASTGSEPPSLLSPIEPWIPQSMPAEAASALRSDAAAPVEPLEPVPAPVSRPAPVAAERLAHLRALAAPDEHPRRPGMLVLGRLAAFTQRVWNRMLPEPAPTPAAQRQQEFNASNAAIMEHLEASIRVLAEGNDFLVARMEQLQAELDRLQAEVAQRGARLDHMQVQIHHCGAQLGQIVNSLSQERYDRGRLGQVLAEYIAEANRELGELAYEMQRLRGPVGKP